MRIFFLVVALVFTVVACGKDELSDLRKMTVTDYLNDRPLLTEILDKCSDREIIDDVICTTAIKAVNNIHDVW